MRNNLALLISLVFLTACGGSGGGGGGSTGSTLPVGIVAGASFDGLILGGTISVYDYTGGTQGALLGTATTDGSTGLYSVSLQIESRPILLVETGGFYVEEAGNPQASVTLTSTQKLTAVENYVTGSVLNLSVTTYSHIAAGLAAYEIRHGVAVPTAINDANSRISNLVGTNILTTTPLEVTDVANASASLTPGLRYGFLAGAISEWTLNNVPSGATPHLPPYTSINFAQLAYLDISADGLLDGVGLDSSGSPVALSFGSVPLGVNIYRLALGQAIVVMAADTNNKTTLKGPTVLPFAQSYVASTDAIFNGVTPRPLYPPVVTVMSPATNTWARRTINVSASIVSYMGVGNTELLVDGTSIASSALNSATPSFALDTTPYADGTHSISVRATDLAGQISTSPVSVQQIDNTAPSFTMSCIFLNRGTSACNASGTYADNYSGVASLVIGGQTMGIAGGTSGTWSGVINVLYIGTTTTATVTDVAGNCSNYAISTVAGSIYTLTSVCP